MRATLPFTSSATMTIVWLEPSTSTGYPSISLTLMRPAPSEPASAAQPLQFLPLELASAGAAERTAASCEQAPPATEPTIQVELHRGGTQLTVRWPASHAGACAAWLRELAIAASKP